ncbi:MAG TPA: hypothetical protein VFX02_06250 [Gammaproteobacteria bacterium]|nr:hypothetical protein [Gammaproteobacteria bacterium]
MRLYTELYDFSPFELGSLRIQGNKILAVIVDVEQDPPCRSEWVAQALDRIFEHAAKIRTPMLSLPLLGHCYGGLQLNTSLQLILAGLLEHKSALPARIQLRMPRTYMPEAWQVLAAAGLMENQIYPLFRS